MQPVSPKDPATSAFEKYRRSAAVGAGCGADILLNYPMWIVAKRMGVGLPAMPATIPELYKGGGSLWASLGPTTIIEDLSKVACEDHLLPNLLPGGIDRELVASVFAGAFAA